jgi:forespore regulator of the sigma-K checkpoint
MLLTGLGSLAAVLLQKNDSGTANQNWIFKEQPAFNHQLNRDLQPEEEVRQMMNQIDGQRQAFAQKTYVCGEELQQLGQMNAQQILQYHKEHPNWTVKLSDKGEVLFTERIEDLSPQCKHNAHFGLDANGNLSLFEGTPEEQQVIRTFFQLNIQYLESSLPRETVKQLYHGIPVSNVDEYNSVLSTFADFAVEETERVVH